MDGDGGPQAGPGLEDGPKEDEEGSTDADEEEGNGILEGGGGSGGGGGGGGGEAVDPVPEGLVLEETEELHANVLEEEDEDKERASHR